jgi:spermidine synthase
VITAIGLSKGNSIMGNDKNDLTRAVWVFGVCSIFLLLGAAFGLTSWPMGAFADAVWTLSLKKFFLIFSGFSACLIMLFWGGRPSRTDQWTAFLSWPIIAAVFWYMYAVELHFNWEGYPGGYSALEWLICSMAVPASVLLAIRVLRPIPLGRDLIFESHLRYLTVMTLLFLAVPGSALDLTATLHPLTYDFYLLKWDRAAGLNFALPLLDLFRSSQLVEYVLGFTYNAAPPLCFLILALRQLRNRPPYVSSAVLTWVVMTAAAWLAYHAFPVAGPKYVFGSHILDGLKKFATLPLQMVGAQFAPRNGMPSMHFGWMFAVSVLWWQSGTAWWSRAVLIVLTMLTMLATLSMGEHYVADLIVAVPFVLASIALCTTAVPWSAMQRNRTVLIGFGTWAVWVVLLRTSIHWLVAHPWACWLMILATVAVVAQQSWWMKQFPALVKVNDEAPARPIPDTQQRSLTRRLGLMFFVSGAAALVYQVLFAKQLALVFGSTSTATLTVLATFLGGMAIGSLAGSRLALIVKRPLAAYAMLEMAIAGYCVLTPFLFDLIQQLYVMMASGHSPDAPILLVLRVVLGAFVLLVPTVLMGATLPVLTQALGQSQRVGINVAWLYFANTGGAAVGALLTGYAVIPAIGASSTTLVAAVLNMLVALGAIELAKKWKAEQPDAVRHESNACEAAASLPRRAAMAALLALCIGGVLSLGLEVVYVHMLSIVAGNSVYAFGLMLATFLMGLAGGGEIARRLLLKPGIDRIMLLVWSLLGLATSVAMTVWWWNDIPEYFGSFAPYPAARTFASREAIRGIVCALLMMPPTLFIGAAYAFGMDIATAAGRGKQIIMLGYGASLNTLGNITGVLVFGFGLLPWLGGLATNQVIAFGALGLAVLVLLITAVRITRRDAVILAGVTAVVLFSLKGQLNYDVLSSGANVYFYPQNWGKVIEHAESIDGGLTSVTVNEIKGTGQIKTLLTNGKFQGNDATKGEMQAQVGFALASLLHQEKRERALVIGYGTGVTSRVIHEAGFRHLDIAELSRDVVRLADTHFAGMNANVTSAPGVNLHVTDGRNLLLLSSKQEGYDLISMEISSIWFAGAASLYNSEFYALAKSRMSKDGVLQQWVQLHHMAPTDILSVITTLRAQFRYVSLYVIGGQGILVATNSEARKSPTKEAMRLLETAPELQSVRGIFERSISTIANARLLDNASVDRYITTLSGGDPKLWVSTDDNLYLEYSTPKGNVYDAQRSEQKNFEQLKRFH